MALPPSADPGFAAATKKIESGAAGLKKHPPAKSEAKKAADAAVPPAKDKEAQAKAAKADSMGAAKPGAFDKAAFIAQVKESVAAKAPKNLDEANNFGGSGKAGEIKAEVAGKVSEGKSQAAGEITTKTQEPPDPSKAVDKPVSPLVPEKAPAKPTVDAAGAMPKQAPPEQTDLSGGQQAADAAMGDAGVSEDQLAKSNEPEFTGAVAAKKEGEAHSAAAPAQFREAEQEKLGATKQQADGASKGMLAKMFGAKKAGVAKGGAAKSAAKAKDEQERARVTREIQGIFDATKTEVTTILGALDAAVGQKFETGERAARAAFTADHTKKMDAYKEERYSGLRGKARWIRDKFKGLPQAANNIYQESKKVYETQMEACISSVADHIGAQLQRAKDRIAEGQSKIKAFVAQQPANLQKFAQQTANKFEQEFTKLEGEVDSKKDELAEDLATRYNESRQAVDAEIEEMQEANKGLWDKAIGAIAGVIKTILQLKDMLLGVLARAANAIGKIIKDPIGFLGNFVNAVKAGITNFAANIVDHLKAGLKGWLFGALSSAGIELPEKFDLPGIIKLVLGILGLTWANIRARITKHIPEGVMDKVEQGVEIIQVVVKEGLGGLWKWVLEKVGDLKEMVMAQIQDFVITKIIKAGITWLISLLNPAAAFIKACKMIYDVVMFFVEKGSQIKEFVDSVLDSIESIAGGGVGAVAGLIEKTLARTLPLVLGFLASLLGLGGISEKIKEILKTVQKPVMSVVDKVVGAAVKYGKKFLAGAKALGKKALGKLGRDDSPEGKKKRLDAGMTAAVAAANRFADKPVGAKVLKPLLGAIKLRYGMSSLSLIEEQENWAVVGVVNPRADQKTRAKTEKVASAKATMKVKAAAKPRGLKPSGLDPATAQAGIAVLTQADRDYLSSRWRELAGTAGSERTEFLKFANDAKAGRRPDPRASEREIAWLHESVGGRTQVSYREGRAEAGEGSSRPDIQVSSWNIETKRYIIKREGGKSELIAELRRQFTARLRALPAHMQFQAIIVDVRGQYLTPVEIEALQREVYQQVVVACYREALAAGVWWVSASASAPGPDTVTVLAGDVG